MALVFITQYELTFDTTAGEDINWEVEVLRSYDDAVHSTVPSTFLTTPVRLIGSGDPVVYKGVKEGSRDGIYKPIQGSTVDLNVIVNNLTRGEFGSVENFNSGGPYEWKLRIRYRDADNNLQPYWCGYFKPVSTTETVSTVPFDISFTALDGLGLLEQATPPRPTDDTQVSIFQNIIVPALRQTGLELDIYVDSGIINGANDAMASALSSSFSVYKSLEGEGELFTYKELLEGWLSAFHNHIKQAKGRWYIYNASTLADNTTWRVFNAQGIAQSNVTENVVRTLNETSTTHLVQGNQKIKLTRDRPAGSIECRPTGLVEREFAANGSFDARDSSGNIITGNTNIPGWTINTASSGGNRAAFVEDINLGGRQGGALRINRTLRDYNSGETGAIMATNSTGYNVSRNSPVEIKFDTYWTRITGTGVIHYEIYVDFDQVMVEELNTQFNYNWGNYYGNYGADWGAYDYGVGNPNAVSRLYWDADNEQWVTRGSSATLIEAPRQEDTGVWSNNTTTVRGPATFFTPLAQASIANARLFVRFYALEESPNPASYTRETCYIDNVSVKNMFDEDEITPVFERVQANFDSTLMYQPLFSSSIDDAIYQKVSPDEFLERGELVTTNTRTLEQLGTQWKLNDYRDEFRYYEGDLINLSSEPLHPINKISIDYPSVGYTESSAGIIEGGDFSLKHNKFNTSFYIPTQATDIASQYFTMNVNLTPMPFPGLSEKVIYTIAFRVTARDAANMTIENGLVPTKPYLQFVGSPGEVIETEVRLVPATGYIGNVGGTTVTANSEMTPRPTSTTFTTFAANQGDITLPLTITIPRQSEFEELFIAGSVTEFTPEATPGVVSSTVVVTNSGTNLAGDATTTYDVSGVPGSTVHFTHSVQAAENFQLFAGNFDATYSDTSLTNRDAVDGINSVNIDFAYSIPTTAESVAVTVTGNATPAGTVGVDLFTRTVNFGTAPANVSFHEASNTFTGVPGATQDYFITLIPDADYQIISPPAFTLPTGVVANGAPFQAGENWEVPIQVTIPMASDTVNATITASATLEPYSVTFVVNNLGVENASITPIAPTVLRFDEGDFGDSISPFTVTVSPAPGMMFTSAQDIVVDINEASVRTPNGTVMLAEDDFTADVQLSGGNINIVVAGNYPRIGDQYVLDINIIGFDDGVAQPANMPATRGDITGDINQSFDFSAHTVVFPVVANGSWNVETDDSWITIENVLANDLTVGSFRARFDAVTAPVSGTIRLSDGQSPGTIIDTVQIHRVVDTVPLATSGGTSISSTSNTTIAYDDPESSLNITVVSDGRWQIGDGNTSQVVGAGTVHYSPPSGSAGTTNVTVTFSGGAGALWQGNNLIVTPSGVNTSIATFGYNIYKSVVTQQEYNSISGSAPTAVRNATFYIT